MKPSKTFLNQLTKNSVAISILFIQLAINISLFFGFNTNYIFKR